MPFNVRFSVSSRDDLRSIHEFIAREDSPANADYVARGIVKAALTLSDLPSRGAHPPELLRHGSRGYRQIFFKPYRILYRIRGKTVFIVLIADGRRDMLPLLIRRLSKP